MAIWGIPGGDNKELRVTDSSRSSRIKVKFFTRLSDLDACFREGKVVVEVHHHPAVHQHLEACPSKGALLEASFQVGELGGNQEVAYL